MAHSTASKPKLSPAFLIVGVAVVVSLILGGAWLRQTAPPVRVAGASTEATAYLPYLQLSAVTMKGAENFMQQQVVYIDGKILNNGPKAIERIDVFCIFSGTDGREVYRERVPVVQSMAGTSFKPHETRAFDLPFDMPDNWNRAMPRLVIAQIRFAR